MLCLQLKAYHISGLAKTLFGDNKHLCNIFFNLHYGNQGKAFTKSIKEKVLM